MSWEGAEVALGWSSFGSRRKTLLSSVCMQVSKQSIYFCSAFGACAAWGSSDGIGDVVQQSRLAPLKKLAWEQPVWRRGRRPSPQ